MLLLAVLLAQALPDRAPAREVPRQQENVRCIKDSFGNYTCTNGDRVLRDSFGNVIVVPGRGR